MIMAGKVLVTGVPGWLGNRFLEYLKDDERSVRCVTLPGMNTSSIDPFGCEIIPADLTISDSLKGITDGIETVFHIAGIIHPKFFRTGDLHRINTLGTKNLLNEAIKSNVKRFIYISSNSAVGCNRDNTLLMNEYTPEKPYMKYGWSKYHAEQLVNEAYLKGLLETVIIRPCWYYGPGQPERQTRLMKMIRDGKGLIVGDGQNLRSMTYIDNLCEALLLAEDSLYAKGETYWIADERPYSMMEIYQVLADIQNIPLKVQKIPGFLGDIATLCDKILQSLHMYQQEVHVAGELNKNIACSIAKAQKDLGYQPKIDLKEGMQRSLVWAKEHNQIE
jgi:nucleoside-diphosphate-sugar epimerase